MIQQDFIVKRNALFACLDNASNELKGTTLDQSKLCGIVSVRENATGETELVYRNNRIKRMGTSPSPERALKHLRGKESIFKKPELPISKCLKPRKVPDYQVFHMVLIMIGKTIPANKSSSSLLKIHVTINGIKFVKKTKAVPYDRRTVAINPHKWKKYSLSDVDISDQTNTAAAFTFLRQMDEQKELSQHGHDASNDVCFNEHKIEFKKISKIRRNLKVLEEQDEIDGHLDVPKLKGTKLIMPEYVVGQGNRPHYKRHVKNLLCKKEKDKDKEKTDRVAAGKLSLAHLQEEEEDEDI